MSKQLLKVAVDKERTLAKQNGDELWGDQAWTTRELDDEHGNLLYVARLRKQGGFITVIAGRECALATEDGGRGPENDYQRGNTFGPLGAVLEDLTLLSEPIARRMVGLPATVNDEGVYTIGVGGQPFSLGQLGRRRLYRFDHVEELPGSKVEDYTPVNFALEPGPSVESYGATPTLGGVMLRDAGILVDWRIPKP